MDGANRYEKRVKRKVKKIKIETNNTFNLFDNLITIILVFPLIFMYDLLLTILYY